MSIDEVMKALFVPFDPSEVKFKPQAVKGNRALAIAYVDARTVMDRLDSVLGPDQWSDTYEVLKNDSVVCTLRCRLGGEWVVKTDVGSPSEQPDEHDRMKASFSDALKRAAVKFGVGRYLYRLPQVWAEYDPTKRQFVTRPALPAWAVPGGKAPAKAEPKKNPAVSPASPKATAEDLELLGTVATECGFTGEQLFKATGATKYEELTQQQVDDLIVRMRKAKAGKETKS
jgi:hypothetical protein